MAQTTAQQKEELREKMKAAVDLIAFRSMYCNSYIWGDLPVKLPSGKIGYIKTLITYTYARNIEECVQVCEKMGAKNVYYDFDLRSKNDI